MDVPPPVEAILARTPAAPARLAVTGRTSFLLDPAQEGFLMMQTRMGCLVACGDPVGEGDDAVILDDFLRLARAGGRVPVIRHARRDLLPLYLSRGLVARKSGEERVVALDRLSPDPSAGPAMAGALDRMDREGVTLEVVASEWVPPLVPELQELDPELEAGSLARGLVAVLRRRGRIVAFAGLWTGSPGGEAALGRVRIASHAPDPSGVWLLAALLLWARNRGFARFSLGREGDGTPGRVVGARAALEESLPVHREPLFTLRPGGFAGAWAALILGALSEPFVHPA